MHMNNSRRNWLLVVALTLLIQPFALERLPRATAQKADASPSPAPKGYELRATKNGAIRFKRDTGETWLSPHLGAAWKKITEPEKLPVGDYDIVLGSGSVDSATLRIDHVTGTVWHISIKDDWAMIEEPK
jgi:hypothetical protein